MKTNSVENRIREVAEKPISGRLNLVQYKKEKAKAVRDAHREYRQLRRETVHSKGKRVPDGLMGICIIPLSILKGKKAFNCIK